MSNSICAFPWAGAAVRPDGIILPCCKFIHKKEFGNINDLDPRESDRWNSIRQDMLDGKMISNCESCYRDEQSGIKSLRQESLEYLVPVDSLSKKLQQLEVSFDNKCNLACVMCSEDYSTKWQSEKIKHRGLVAKGITAHGFDYLKWDLSQVTRLKIIGGEPMMSQDQFVKLLNHLRVQDLHVVVATNGTILPNEQLKNIFEKCRSVSYKVSLDGIGAVNDWIRWPSKFKDIEQNINILDSWWSDKENINLQFHSVINIYNLLHLKELVDYILEKKNWTVTWNWIKAPAWQSVSVLPDKDKVIDQLMHLGSSYSLDPNPFLVSIDRMNDRAESNWNDAVNETKRLIGERNISPIGFSVD